jgi:hypothetical protein
MICNFTVGTILKKGEAARAFGNWNRRHQMAAAEAAAEAAELSGTDRMWFSTIM